MSSACKVEYAWSKWPSDPLEISKKYFSTIEKALEYCNISLLHHKNWRILQNGKVIQTLMGQILGIPTGGISP